MKAAASLVDGSTGAQLQLIAVDSVDDHPHNPRLVYRDDVIDAIVANLNGEWPRQHALHVRPVGGRYELIGGHHRIRAARKRGLDSVWAWVDPLAADEAFMLLATENSQGELSPLELGRHVLDAVPLTVGGRGKKDGLAEYARRLGKSAGYLTQLRQAAEVLAALGQKPFTQANGLLDKAKHLCAIHAAPGGLWRDLAELMLSRKWSAADTEHWVGQLGAFEDAIPEKWAVVFLDPLAAMRRFLETREFSARTVARLAAQADVIDAAIDACGEEVAARRDAFYEWLRANAGGKAWDVREVEKYERQLRAEWDRERQRKETSWALGDWRDHIGLIDDGTFALLLTDPPYGVDFQSDYRLDRRKDRKHASIENDDLAATREVEECLTAFRPKLADSAHVLCFVHWSNEPEMRAAIERAGYTIRGSLVWVKNNRGMGDPNTTFAPQHERIIHAVKGSPTLFEREADVLSYDRCTSERHPTEKPVDLLARLIEVTTVEGEMVADPFGGVASTLVAAKGARRGFWGAEKSAEFHAAGLERLQA